MVQMLTRENAPVHLAIGTPASSALDAWSDFPAAAQAASGRIACGRGLTEAACRASVMGELAELVATVEWGDEELTEGVPSALSVSCLTPEELTGLTDRQYEERDSWNAIAASYDWRPAKPAANSAIALMEAVDADGKPLLLPADAVLLGRREPGDEEAVAIGDSNGCAAGESLDSAKLAAILELVERDALARWWYGRRARPGIRINDVAAFAPEAEGLVSYLRARPRRTLLIDITTDLEIPAYVAVSAAGNGRSIALGHAAGLSPASVAVSALTEMMQVEASLEMALAVSEQPWTWKTWLQEVSLEQPPLANRGETIPLPSGPGLGATAALAFCLSACQDRGIRLAILDRTRPDIGIPVAQILSPDLCHFKPRFARQRLLSSDVRDLGAVSATPNPVPLLI